MLRSQLIEHVTPHLGKWLGLQRWADKEHLHNVQIVDSEMISNADNYELHWVHLKADDVEYSAFIGLAEATKPLSFLLGHDDARIADLDVAGKSFVAYDALFDPDLANIILSLISNGSLVAEKAKLLQAEQSNTSLVYDDKYIAKMFRRVQHGVNLDVEVTSALTTKGYQHVAPVLCSYSRGDLSIAVCQTFFEGGKEGWELAVESAKQYISDGNSTPNNSFVSDAKKIGEMTAGLHVALADCFETQAFDNSGLVQSLESSKNNLEKSQQNALSELIEQLKDSATGDLGRAVRLHGDYHLGQTMKCDADWKMFDFEGEPVRPLVERMKPGSAYKDVAGLVRSFQYGSATALFAQGDIESDDIKTLANQWESDNRSAFLDGYFSFAGIDELLPSGKAERELLLQAFEVEKAIYELNYELAYRPNWVAIPRSALNRLLG